MTEDLFQERPESNLLLEIKAGMTVYDREGQKIGEVDTVFAGAKPDDLEELGHAPADVDVSALDLDTLPVDAAEVMGDEDLDEPVRERLMRRGFARIDAGLLDSDRYVMPDQIASVTDDEVRLNVLGEELVERE